MKKYVRLICLVLGIMMAVTSFAGCSDTSDDEKGSGNESEEATEAVSTDPEYTSDLSADVKFTGQTVSMLAFDKDGVNDELYSEGAASEDRVSNAVYQRNLALKKRLDLDDLYIELDPLLVENGRISNLIQANNGDFDIVSYSTNDSVRDLVKGYYYDLNKVENLDISKKYWTQGYSDIVSCGKQNKQYLVTGAPALSLYRYTFVTVFNQTYLNSVQWENLYDVVYDGNWTLEYQFDMLTNFPALEQDGLDGITEGDFVGFVTGDCVSVDPYLTASGIHIIKKDDEGKWYFDYDTGDRVGTMIDRVRQIYKNSGSTFVYASDAYDNTGLLYIAQKFAKNEAIMATVQLYALESTSGDIKFDYGILPIPKFDTAQDDYYAYTQDQVSSFGILSTVPADNLPKAGAALDILAYESYYKVVPEYYGKALSYKFLQNAASKEMLDYIFDRVEFDFVGAFSALLSPVVRDQMRVFVYSETDPPVASSYTAWKKSLRSSLQLSFNSLIDKLK